MSQIPSFWSTSLHLPLVLLNVAFWSLKKQAPNVAKLPKVRLCESQTPRSLVFAFPLMRHGWGLRIVVFSRRFRESSAKERAKVKAHFEGSGPVSLATNCLISNNLSWEGDSVMLAAYLHGCEELIRDNFVWFGRWWMNLYKRSCCSTCVPRKINMEVAEDSRKVFVFREEWPFPDKGILINNHI